MLQIDKETVSNPEALVAMLSTMRSAINAIMVRINSMTKPDGGSVPQSAVEGPAQLINKN